jgi:hypothetical protein
MLFASNEVDGFGRVTFRDAETMTQQLESTASNASVVVFLSLESPPNDFEERIFLSASEDSLCSRYISASRMSSTSYSILLMA